MMTPPCAMSTAFSSTVSVISVSKPKVMMSLNMRGLFPVILFVGSALSLRHVTYLVDYNSHFSGTTEAEVISFAPPVFRFGRILRFLILPCTLISVNTVASDDLMPSSGKVPVVTLTLMETN